MTFVHLYTSSAHQARFVVGGNLSYSFDHVEPEEWNCVEFPTLFFSSTGSLIKPIQNK